MGSEVRRFILLNYEPYLTFLSSDEWIKYASNYKKLKKELSNSVKESYKGENIDYIEFTFRENITEFELSNRLEAIKSSKMKYSLLGVYSLKYISKNLMSNSRIKDYELYKFIGLYIEPLQIIFSYLIDKGITFNPKSINEQAFYDLSIFGNKKLSETHMHVETSYLYRDLIDYFIRNLNKTGYHKGAKNFLKDINFITVVNHILTVSEDRRLLNFANTLLKTKVSYTVPRAYSFRKFNYRKFIYNAIQSLFTDPYDENSYLYLIALQKLNRIMGSLVFQGEYKGLVKMKEYFDNGIKNAFQDTRRLNKKDFIKVESFENRLVQDLEVRAAPDKEQIEYWTCHSKENNIDIKFVLHYKKFKSFEKIQEFYLQGEKFAKDLFRDTYKLFRFLTLKKDCAKYIVGFDAASVEYWTPPWIYRDIFRFWKAFFRIYFGRNIGLTFHAGEDFIDSLTGLRYIYEAIKFLEVDRIGHGLSLIIDHDTYSLKYSKVKLNPLHYFFHLLWLVHMCYTYPVELSELSPALEKAINDFINDTNNILVKLGLGKINNKSNTFYSINKLYESLGFSRHLYKESAYGGYRFNNFNKLFNTIIVENYADIGYAKMVFEFIKRLTHIYIELPFKPYATKSSYEKLAYIISPLLPKEYMTSERQMEFVKKINNIIADIVSERKIVLELCPSSNIILYNIRSYKRHPIFTRSKRDIRLSINTDNPLLLNTNLALEYLLIYEASNYDRELITKLIHTSNESTFKNI